MYLKTTRWLALFLALLTCASLLTAPVMAAEDGGDEAETPAVALTEEAPEVNVIDLEETEPTGEETTEPEQTEASEAPAPEGSQEELPVAEQPAETEAPEETVEPEPEQTEEPAETPSEESAQPEETAQPAETEEPEEETPVEEPSGEPSVELDGAGTVKISYYNGKTLLAEEEVEKGKAPTKAPAKAGSANIKAWTDDKGKLVKLSELKVQADASYYAWFLPKLKTAEHGRYINGTGNAKFSPNTALTRAQAATILYQLLDSAKAGPFDSTFSDVASGAWYATAVKTLASIGVVNGYPNGTFRPEKAVTRAEFVTMLVNLTEVTGGKSSFSDVSAKHWAREAIMAATGQGWVNGYKVSSKKYEFRPNNNITRAEAVVVMNRVLGRSADAATLASGKGILHYLDVKSTDWFYGDVMEASIGHTYTKSGSKEKWNKFNVESTGLTAGLHKVGSSFVYVDANGQLTAAKAGINKIAGKYYYAASDGYSFDADLSSKANTVVFANGKADQKLTNGFNKIGSSLFYWKTAKKAPVALKAGLNQVAGKTYWADKAGYIIRNDFGKGLVKLNGKYYLSDGACAIITQGVACATGKESSKPTTIKLKDHTVEFNGSMYYLNSDYTVARNTWKGYLYFGSNGRYTSGDSTLDGYVYNILNKLGVLTNTSLTQVQKLLKAYYYLRGGEGTDFRDSGYSYRQIGHAYSKLRYNGQVQYGWQIDCAKYMFKNKCGMCYEWGTAMLFLARRLGFQAYVVVGTITPNALHCWNVIKWSGKWHLTDVEIEWGWMQGYYGGGRRLYRNLFDQTMSSEKIRTYTNPECGLTYTFPS